MKRYVFIILLIYLHTCLLAQTTASFTFKRSDGLPSNTVYDVFQSTDGYVWVATQNGLARFNGYSFKTYNNPHLRSMAVGNILEDKYGKIWLKSFFGEIMYVEDDSMHILEEWQAKIERGFPMIGLTGDSLIISDSRRAYFYDLRKGNFVDSLDRSHFLLAPLPFSFWRYNAGSEGFSIVNVLNPRESYRYPDLILGLHLAEIDCRRWFFSPETKALYEARPDGRLESITANYKPALAHTRSIKEVRKGIVAFIGTDGFWLLYIESGKLNHYLKGENISCITAIREGGYLVGTLNEGLKYIPALDSKVLNGSYVKIDRNERTGDIVAGGFNGGMSIVKANLGNAFIIPPEFPREVQALSIDEGHDKIMVYTNQLYEYSLDNFSLLGSIRTASTKDILHFGGVYYLATSRGLRRVKDGKVEYDLNGVRCTALTADTSRNVLWIGSQIGLFELDIDEGGPSTAVRPSALDRIPGVTELAFIRGYLLMGTASNGLFVFDAQYDLYHHFDEQTGLPSNNITALFANGDEIWAGTDRGLVKLNLFSRKAEVFDRARGLVAEEIYDIVTDRDHIWVVHNTGVQRLSKMLSRNRHNPLLEIDRILVDNKKVDSHHERIRLKPDQRQLSLLFDVANSFKALGSTNIYFRIKELNENEWDSTTLKNPRISYLSLSPGTYTFEAYAANEDGAQSPKVQLPFQVSAPFYQQLWFVIMNTVLVCLIVGGFLYARVIAISRRRRGQLLLKSREQALKIARLTSIRAQMNPHFIFNTMSLIQAYVYGGKPDLASKVIRDFSQLMRKVLDFSQEETISLANELDVVKCYLEVEKDRSEGQLIYSIIVDEEIATDMIRVPSLITQPYVENAIKHGLMHKNAGDKKLELQCSVLGDYLLIRIIDNGIGRKAARELQERRYKNHKPFATEAYKKRMELYRAAHNEDIQLTTKDLVNERGRPAGTQVDIKIRLTDE